MLANAMPENEEDDQTPPDDDLRRRPIPVDTPPIDLGITANGAQQARAIPVGSTADLESRVRPALTRSVPVGRAIPVDASQQSPAMVAPTVAPSARAIPIGSTGDLESRIRPMAKPITVLPEESPYPATAAENAAPDPNHVRSGVASLWANARNISHPVPRVLAEIGAGLARGLDVAGQAAGKVIPAIGGIESAIPGTEGNARAQENRQAQQEAQQAKVAGEQATAEHTKAETGAIPATVARTEAETEAIPTESALKEAQTKNLLEPTPKQGLTPEETTIHDLMAGQNGQPRINPQTQQPYTYLDAYQAVKQAGQDVKPQKPEKPDTPEQQFIDMETAKGVPLAKAISDYAAASQKPERVGDQSAKVDARADKSYTYNNNKLDQLATPIEQAVGRLGRLRDTLAQGTPQADALVAPELLTVMAGGAGSGLRMNEAEISRIVGGRSKWESLQAAVNQWRTDPTKANSITPEQRQEIHALMDVVTGKLTAKQQALDAAREKLLDSDDPKEHRRIVTDAHHALTQVDEGAGKANNEPERPSKVPANYIYQENGPKGKGWYKPKTGGGQ